MVKLMRKQEEMNKCSECGADKIFSNEICHKCYNKENREKVNASSRKWKKENPVKVNTINRKWKKSPAGKTFLKEYKKKPIINISIRLRYRLWMALKLYTRDGKIKSSNKYGINYKAIIKYLEPFPEDRSLYHIDHIKPLCSFNFINEDGNQNLEEIKKAFAPENHQWLLIKDNLFKGGKWEEPENNWTKVIVGELKEDGGKNGNE